MRFLILAHEHDELAVRVNIELQRRHGPDHVRLVSDVELAFAPKWYHYLDNRDTCTELELPDSTRLSSRRIGVVFNRLVHVAPTHFAGSKRGDIDYAVMETHALWLSWLASLPCPVINPATTRSLSSPGLSALEWLQLAAEFGLAVRGYHVSTNARRYATAAYDSHPVGGISSAASLTAAVPASGVAGQAPALFLEPIADPATAVTVVGDQVVGPLSGLWDDALAKLCSAAGCELMEATFAPARTPCSGDNEPENWRFCSATGFIQSCRDEVINRIAKHLENAGRGRPPK